jgi:hypothetical protein
MQVHELFPDLAPILAIIGALPSEPREKKFARNAWTPGLPKDQQEIRILNVSYNESILRTRHAILEEAGFKVVSALGFTEGLELCSKGQERFSLAIFGPSLPSKDKALLMVATRDLCKCPVLSLRRPGSDPLPEADYSIDSTDGPEAFLAAVQEILGRK